MLAAIAHARRHLGRWMKKRRRRHFVPFPARVELDPAAAARGGRNRQPVELPAATGAGAGRRGPGRRQSGDDQAQRDHAPVFRSAGAADRPALRRRRMRGRDRRRRYRPRLRPAALPSPVLHRLHRGRPQGGPGGGGQPDAGDAGAGRQVAGDRGRQQRPGGRRPQDRRRQAVQRRPDLHRTGLRAGARWAAAGVRPGFHAGRRPDVPDAGEQPRLHQHRRRAPLRAAPGAGAGRAAGRRAGADDQSRRPPKSRARARCGRRCCSTSPARCG